MRSFCFVFFFSRASNEEVTKTLEKCFPLRTRPKFDGETKRKPPPRLQVKSSRRVGWMAVFKLNSGFVNKNIRIKNVYDLFKRKRNNGMFLLQSKSNKMLQMHLIGSCVELDTRDQRGTALPAPVISPVVIVTTRRLS